MKKLLLFTLLFFNLSFVFAKPTVVQTETDACKKFALINTLYKQYERLSWMRMASNGSAMFLTALTILKITKESDPKNPGYTAQGLFVGALAAGTLAFTTYLEQHHLDKKIEKLEDSCPTINNNNPNIVVA